MVKPMMRGDNLARIPTLVAPLTSQFAPMIKATKPRRSNSIGIKEVIYSFLLWLMAYGRWLASPKVSKSAPIAEAGHWP
jgi:hypothetical protein